MNIKELKIFTSQLAKQKAFYIDILGLHLISETITELVFKVGSTRFIIVSKEKATPYHYAINIPNNQIDESVKWLKNKGVSILPFNGEEVVNFSFINAYSTYFYDADKNIVEFIAREKMDNSSSASFTAHSLLEISEIGLPTKDIPSMFAQLQSKLTIDLFSGDTERFAMIGDESGMFLCINTDKKNDWVPTNDVIEYSDFGLLTADGVYVNYIGGKLVI